MNAAEHLVEHELLGIRPSLTPAPGKIPLAGADGKLDPAWLRAPTNDIGTPGALGFGVGICPNPPAGYSPMVGTTVLGHDNYGNYTYTDGSVMVWIPRCWFKIGFGIENNGLDVNKFAIKPAAYFADEAAANAAGYMSHRADWDGGVLQPGFFIDKHICSASNGKASSLKNGSPMISGPAAGQIGFAAVGAANACYGAIAAAKTRGAEWFPASRFIFAKLALLSLVHAQASTSTTYCAWYDAAGVTNFPKGCNGNNLRDTNDNSVIYTSAGASSYPNMPLTGSGTPLSKTTHNGQACGVADLNGTVWEVNLGITCIAVSKNITSVLQSNPVQVKVAGHGFETGDYVQTSGVGGMTKLNDRIFKVTVIDADWVSLDGCDATAFTPYTSGGTLTMGRFYASKKSTRMRDYTAGTTLATDHWGATGVAATMDRITPAFRIDYPNNGFAQRFGNAAGQVLSPDLSGNGWLLTGLGFPLQSGISASGTNQFGQDYFYQYIRDQLCLISGANWDATSGSGVSAATLDLSRSSSSHPVGFRAASYLGA